MNSYTIQDLTTVATLDLLKEFVRNLGEAETTFRYFNKRSLDIVRSHLISLLVLEEHTPVAYGHLEKHENIIWLGVCVLPKYKGKKIGLLVMTELIAKAKAKGVSQIELTVDKENYSAISLYKKLGFAFVFEFANYYRYKLTL